MTGEQITKLLSTSDTISPAKFERLTSIGRQLHKEGLLSEETPYPKFRNRAVKQRS